MIHLVDTNVVLRYALRTHLLYSTVRGAIRKIRSQGNEFRVTPQNLIEAWHVATRPVSQNGFGRSLAEADRLLRRVERSFHLLADSAGIYPEWRRLVTTFGVSGVRVYDARLVAAMLVHGVTHILTFNVSDFARYAPAGIVAVDPATV